MKITQKQFLISTSRSILSVSHPEPAFQYHIEQNIHNPDKCVISSNVYYWVVLDKLLIFYVYFKNLHVKVGVKLNDFRSLCMKDNFICIPSLKNIALSTSCPRVRSTQVRLSGRNPFGRGNFLGEKFPGEKSS